MSAPPSPPSPPSTPEGRFLAACTGNNISYVASQLPLAPGLANARDAKGRTPLVHCSRRGHVELVQLLLASGAQVDPADASVLTALHHAVLALGVPESAAKAPSIVRALLAAGADPRAKDSKKASPFHLANLHVQQGKGGAYAEEVAAVLGEAVRASREREAVAGGAAAPPTPTPKGTPLSSLSYPATPTAGEAVQQPALSTPAAAARAGVASAPRPPVPSLSTLLGASSSSSSSAAASATASATASAPGAMTPLRTTPNVSPSQTSTIAASPRPPPPAPAPAPAAAAAAQTPTAPISASAAAAVAATAAVDPALAAFFQKCLEADLMAVVLAVSSNPSLAYRSDAKGGTALHYAARGGSVAVCRALLGKCPEARRSSEVNACSAEGYSPLILAVRGGHGVLLQWLLDNGAHLSGQDANGLNALHHAVLCKRPELLEVALREAHSCADGTPLGDLLSAVDRKGLTPLGLATERQSKGVPPEMVVLLRAAGAEAFLTSCAAGDTSRVKASLGEDPALVAARDPATAFTAIMAAALGASVGCLEALRSGGGDLNAMDGNGRTALMLAARAGQSHICGWLLRAGAKAGATDEDGLTALHHAAKAVVPTAAATLRELLTSSAKGSFKYIKAAKCSKGRTALDYARMLAECGVHATDECVALLS